MPFVVFQLIGLLIVIVFMVIYYKAAGLVADFALLLNIVFVFAVMAGFHATLTLPGIAGIVLTVGLAVDANVLIFERIREELRLGKSPRVAAAAGFDKAWSTIIDANVTTFIAGVVLYTYGTGPVKGFAVTLSLGVLASLFLLLRKVWAVPTFVLSFVAVIAVNINTFLLMNTIEVLGMVPVYVQSVVIAIGLLLILYSRSAKANGLLT